MKNEQKEKMMTTPISGMIPIFALKEWGNKEEAHDSLIAAWETGADLSQRDANGFTALNYARFSDASPEVLELLTLKQ